MRVLPIGSLRPRLLALGMFARPCRPQKKERRSDTTVWLEDTLLLAPSLGQDGTQSPACTCHDDNAQSCCQVTRPRVQARARQRSVCTVRFCAALACRQHFEALTLRRGLDVRVAAELSERVASQYATLHVQ